MKFLLPALCFQLDLELLGRLLVMFLRGRRKHLPDDRHGRRTWWFRRQNWRRVLKGWSLPFIVDFFQTGFPSGVFGFGGNFGKHFRLGHDHARPIYYQWSRNVEQYQTYYYKKYDTYLLFGPCAHWPETWPSSWQTSIFVFPSLLVLAAVSLHFQIVEFSSSDLPGMKTYSQLVNDWTQAPQNFSSWKRKCVYCCYIHTYKDKFSCDSGEYYSCLLLYNATVWLLIAAGSGMLNSWDKISSQGLKAKYIRVYILFLKFLKLFVTHSSTYQRDYAFLPKCNRKEQNSHLPLKKYYLKCILLISVIRIIFCS